MHLLFYNNISYELLLPSVLLVVEIVQQLSYHSRKNVIFAAVTKIHS